ncbi:MAG: hypothetical protein C5S40_07300 [ANME-2 cluster archaeon]|nr:hypothetical protein [ANME-2 cluster archaeon]
MLVNMFEDMALVKPIALGDRIAMMLPLGESSVKKT